MDRQMRPAARGAASPSMDDRTDLSEERQQDVSSDIQLDLRTWLKLLTCTTLISAELRRQLREHFDFTLPRFDMLAQLDREEGKSQSLHRCFLRVAGT